MFRDKSAVASVKISEQTGGAYSDMSDVIDSELYDICGGGWPSENVNDEETGCSDTGDYKSEGGSPNNNMKQ